MIKLTSDNKTMSPATISTEGMVWGSPLRMTVASSAIKLLIDFMILEAWKSTIA